MLVFLTILGLSWGVLGQCQDFTAVVSSQAATPVTWIWYVDGQPFEARVTDATRDQVRVCWTGRSGTRAVAVQASNVFSAGAFTKEVEVGHGIWVPLVRRIK